MMDVDPDLEIIDDLGVTAVANGLNISREAVRLWRVKGSIPDLRREELRQLAEKYLGNDGQAPWPSMPSHLPMVVVQPSSGQSDRSIDLATIDGTNARAGAEAAIAERMTSLACDRANRALEASSRDTAGHPVRFYGLRLAALFALDFPVLTIAFESVAKVSPIIAAGSAIALSLFLVLGAHLIGGALRQISPHWPSWCRSGIVLMTMLMFLSAIIGVTWDLRMKGLDIETFVEAGDRGLVFGGQDGEAQVIPDAFRMTIGYAAALVTVGSLLFGIAWSYRQHGPAAAWQKAEAAYRHKIRHLAKTRARMARRTKSLSAALVGLSVSGLLIGQTDIAHADSCDGGTVLAFIDTTTAYDDVDRDQIVPAIEELASSLIPHQRVIIRTVRDAPGASRLLFDACMPTDPRSHWSVSGLWNWLITNKNELQTEQRAFFADMRASLLPILNRRGSASKTALIETLHHFLISVEQPAAIWLFTDLLESSFVSPGKLLHGDPADLMEAAQQFPRLVGTPVHIAGVGRWHDVDRRPLHAAELSSLIDSWVAFINMVGGELHLVDIDRSRDYHQRQRFSASSAARAKDFSHIGQENSPDRE